MSAYASEVPETDNDQLDFGSESALAIDPSSISPLFSVIIVNWNGLGFLEKAVESLRNQTVRNFQLIVVDNASDDGSVEQLDLDVFADATLLRESENHGFSRAVNLAAQRATGRYLALLNPDCMAEPDWLEQMTRAIELHPDIAMFSSTQISMENSEIIDGAGDNYFFIGIPWRGGFGRHVSELPATGECFSPCGAGAIVKREVFLRDGGFDEDFFCYCEDVDLGFRLRLEGESCLFWRPAVVHHFGSALSGKVSPFTIRHGTRNRVTTYLKNTPPALLAATLPLHLLACAYFVLRTRDRTIRNAMTQGLRESMETLDVTLAKRRAIQKKRKVGSLAMLRSMTCNPAKLSQRRTDVRARSYARRRRLALKAAGAQQPGSAH